MIDWAPGLADRGHDELTGGQPWLVNALAREEEALRLQPDYGIAPANLGHVRFEAGRPRQSRSHYERARGLGVHQDSGQAIGERIESCTRLEETEARRQAGLAGAARPAGAERAGLADLAARQGRYPVAALDEVSR
jgi:hypothetical protein